MREALQYYERALDNMKSEAPNSRDYLTALEGKADAAKALVLFDLAASTYEELIHSNPNQVDRARILRKTAECWLSTHKRIQIRRIHFQ